ncbi:hypothetical protein ACFRCI_49430 [Streptomyces sp. NPDC056638]|uniref:hypothetical protein n=1 Tax=Streptomyces sp. NPDC056638 TaxID=3345887 RepID=UPI00368F2FED
MNLNLFNDLPDGLTQRARSFVRAHGVKVDIRPIEEHRQWWLERDIPAAVIDRMAAYEEQWGGLVLPPSPFMPFLEPGGQSSVRLAPLDPSQWQHLEPGQVITMHEDRSAAGTAVILEIQREPPRVRWRLDFMKGSSHGTTFPLPA